MVNVTDDKLFELPIVTNEFKSVADLGLVEVVCAPSSVKLPELPSVSLSTNPSGSVAVTDAPFNVKAVLAVPA